MIKIHTRFFVTLLLACLVMPFETHAEQSKDIVQAIITKINYADNLTELENILNTVDDQLKNDTNYKCTETTYDFAQDKNEIRSKIGASPVSTTPDQGKRTKQPVETCDTKYKDSAEALACCNTNGMNAWTGKTCTCPNNESWDNSTYTCIDVLEQKQKAYDEAHENEQSLANRTLTAVTTAATGIGGMELARGLAEQSADAAADQDMAAYLATFRCTYGNTVQVKGGPTEIELPGGNDPELMQLRSEYFTLAADLKERKAALGMAPGIESEEILDKSQMGLYDDENTGITSGAYGSLYRVKALESEEDQEKIDAERKASKNRVIAGATVAGAGVVGGMVGNSLINGKLGEKIKELKDKRSSTLENDDIIESIKNSLADRGFTNLENLDLSNIDFTNKNNSLSGIDFTKISPKNTMTDITQYNLGTDNFKSFKSSLSSLYKE